MSSRRVGEVLAAHATEAMASDLGMAMRGMTGLVFATHLPLAEHPAPSPRRWGYLVDNVETFGATVARLDGTVDNLTSPIIVSRIADLLWTELPQDTRNFERHALRALDAYDDVSMSSDDPTDRLAAIWAGSDLAMGLGFADRRDAFRQRVVDSAFALVFASADSPYTTSVDLNGGLMFLYGVAASWRELPIRRELLVIAEVAERRARPFAMPGFYRPTIDWVHRLRYLAATSDAERVRVVEELVADRRAAAASWPDFDVDSPPFVEAAELSRAIEDAADLARRVAAGELRDRLDLLTRELVVELQGLGWRHSIRRPSLVSPEDVSPDARSAESVWKAELAALPTDLGERLSWLRERPSPLDHPEGLTRAALAHLANVGRSRGQFRAYGFLAPDTLNSDLTHVAEAEMARHRLEVWGATVAELLSTASRSSSGNVADLFAGPMIDTAIAERLASGLQLFLEGQSDAAAHVVLPRLEHVIRRVAVALRIPALQIAYQHLGNISYLGALLDALRDRAPASDRPRWELVKLVLVDGAAVGIRNVLSHGLRSDLGLVESVSDQEAALIFYVAALLSGADEQGHLGTTTTTS